MVELKLYVLQKDYFLKNISLKVLLNWKFIGKFYQYPKII
jgi:hypothetical protein